MFGVGRAGEQSTVLTGLATAADRSTSAVDGPWPADDPSSETSASESSAGSSAASSAMSTTRGATSGATTRTTATPATRTSSAVGRSRAAIASTPSTGFGPVVGITADAEILSDLAYADSSPAQKLDLYLPDRKGKAVPLVVVVHGGAFMGGSKSDHGGRAEALVARGYAVASVDYRLSDEAPFPAGAKDVKAAVRWLRASAARYGIDPGRFAAWGDSAGGYFAALIGTTSGLTTSFDDPALGNAKVSSAVQAVVDFYGPVDFLTMDQHAVSPGGCSGQAQVHDAAGSPESLWLGAPVQSVARVARTANPITYLGTSGKRPPFFLAHGLADCDVPHGQSVELASALKKRGVAVTTHLLPGIGHGDPQLDEKMTPLVMTFLGRTLSHT